MAERNTDASDCPGDEVDNAINLYGATHETSPLKGHSDNDVIDLHESDDDGNNLLRAAPMAQTKSTVGGSVHSPGDYNIATKTYADTSWYKHPKIKENWKVVLASCIMFLVGLVLLIGGVVIEITRSTLVQSFVFFIAGAICFIPGAYHMVYIYCAIKGRKGFSFYNLPTFR